MHTIMCELCGSNDVIKQGEYYVCQHCGTKYSLEDAKKLLGTVKIDNSDYVEKYLQNARRARAKGDWAEVEKYYNLVEQNWPQNIEAIFYSSYGKLRCTILENYSAKWDNDVDVLKKSISVLDDYFDMEKEAEERQVIIDAMNDILILASPRENRIHTGNLEGSTMFDGNTAIRNRIVELYPQMAETLDNIIAKYKEKDLNYTYLTEIKNKISVAPGKGCYVATAVYGSYDCPEVWTLRRYRDYTLAESWYGRLFIFMYYSISPTLVRWFGETQWFRNMWKPKLDKMVKRLNEEGVADTPYRDKSW